MNGKSLEEIFMIMGFNRESGNRKGRRALINNRIKRNREIKFKKGKCEFRFITKMKLRMILYFLMIFTD